MKKIITLIALACICISCDKQFVTENDPHETFDKIKNVITTNGFSVLNETLHGDYDASAMFLSKKLIDDPSKTIDHLNELISNMLNDTNSSSIIPTDKNMYLYYNELKKHDIKHIKITLTDELLTIGVKYY